MHVKNTQTKRPTHIQAENKTETFLSRPQILQQPGIKMAYKGFIKDVVRNYIED